MNEDIKYILNYYTLEYIIKSNVEYISFKSRILHPNMWQITKDLHNMISFCFEYEHKEYEYEYTDV